MRKDQDKTEALIFSDFRNKVPSFAGAPVEIVDRGPKDKSGNSCPDFVCVTKSRNKIGVELTEWLNEDQMAETQSLEREEKRFVSLLGTEREEPPEFIGEIHLEVKNTAKFPTSQKKQDRFRKEFFDLIEVEDNKLRSGEEQFGPGGCYPVNDLSGYSTLKEYLYSLVIWMPNLLITRGPGWVKGTMSSGLSGGAYSPNDSLEALIAIIKRKFEKKGYTKAIQKGVASEIYLLVYYNQGRWNTTPYHGNMEVDGQQMQVALPDIARITAEKISGIPSPFSKVFLHNFIEFDHRNPQDHIFQLYPEFEPCIPRPL